MSPTLTADEQTLVQRIPLEELASLAAELDLLLPETIDSTTVVVQCLTSLIELARREGLPFSRYDREDLEALPPDHLRALASLCGAKTTVDGLLKVGQKVYKRYRKRNPGSQIPMLLPTLLAPLARFAALDTR